MAVVRLAKKVQGVRQLVVLVQLVVQRSLAMPIPLAIRLVGVLVAVALVSGVALYSIALGDAMVQATLGSNPSSAYIAVTADTGAPLSTARYAALDHYARTDEQRDLGLPLAHMHIHHATFAVPVYSVSSSNSTRRPVRLDDLALHYYAGIGRQVRMVAGTLTVSPRTPRGDVPVIVSQYTARSLHLQVGDRIAYLTGPHRLVAPAMAVAGIFIPRDSNSDFWDINAGQPTYRSLVAPRVDGFQIIATATPAAHPQYVWLVRTDLAAIHLAAADTILAHLDHVRSAVAQVAPGASLSTSLDLDLTSFMDKYRLLPYILVILVAPIVALILFAVAVISALVVDRQVGEIVLLRSRGASAWQLFWLYAIEGVLLGGIALAVGPYLGVPLANLIGSASGFLTFSQGLPVSVHLTGWIYALAGGTAVLCVLTGLLPIVRRTRQSMNTLKQDQGRRRHRPLWQRLFLDLIVLAASVYGLSVLARQGAIGADTATAVLAQDPLIALTPLLFALAGSLVMSRCLPQVAVLGLRLFRQAASPAAYIALQHVARAPLWPMRLVQLCTLTLTLGIFAATVAGVESSNRSDQAMYEAGAALRLVEYNVGRKTWETLPLAAHQSLPGVSAASPALRFESSGTDTNTTDNGTGVNVLGVDPATAVHVMWFRADFATQPFAQLMSVLARAADNAIVSDTFLSATGLHRGDAFAVTLSTGAVVRCRVAAVAHYFPTLDPRALPFVVTNLTYLERVSRSPRPSEMWLATATNQGVMDRILSTTRTWPRRVLAYEGLTPAFVARDEPLTAGIYGVVSIGFAIAVALLLLSLVVYAYLTLQQRLVEFAIVRTLGLSARQLQGLLLCEQLVLLAAGVCGGVITGVLATRLFLPYLPITVDTMPPFVIVLPWLVVSKFVLTVLGVSLVVLGLHGGALLRLRLGRVLRLGEG